MANGGKNSRLSGWQVQADRLALKHTVVPGLPRTAAIPSPRYGYAEAPSVATPALGADQPSIERSLEERRGRVANAAAQPFSREETREWIQNARKAVLSARTERAEAADRRIAELEASLEAAMERVVFLENENQSLEESLDASSSENFDLTNRLIEAETRGEKVRSELQSSELTRAEYDLTVEAASRKIELLENLVDVKEARLQKLEQARKKMQQDTKNLLTTTKVRDQALADVERRIFVLTELFEQLELNLETGKAEAVSQEIRRSIAQNTRRENQQDTRQDSRQHTQQDPRKAMHLGVNPKPPVKQPANAQKTGRQSQLWQRKLDTDDWLLDGR
jgi:chromosome segregation ATPase